MSSLGVRRPWPGTKKMSTPLSGNAPSENISTHYDAQMMKKKRGKNACMEKVLQNFLTPTERQ